MEKMVMNQDLSAILASFQGKRIFLTGHTGFKGTWLSKILCGAGAQVTGYALDPPTQPNLFSLCTAREDITSLYGDVRDYDSLHSAFEEANPEFVFHLAAQPLVREGYLDPRYTYETNVMGTANLCECLRVRTSKKRISFVNVTTDKVYGYNEHDSGYVESDVLDGFDPYANSKSCSELITSTYERSFFKDQNVACSTARAGNVIGGGDFSSHRIVPDCVRAALHDNSLALRNPSSVRPFQHVLEPLFAYLQISQAQFVDSKNCGSYNVGPSLEDCVTTKQIADCFTKIWGDGFSWHVENEGEYHEAELLRLNTEKIQEVFGWRPLWHYDEAIEKTITWTKAWLESRSVDQIMDNQISDYLCAHSTLSC